MTSPRKDAINLAHLERVVVVGTSCVGKTTFARTIGRILSIDHLELDTVFWGPNWTQKSTDRFRAEITEAVAGDRWIVDGNYSVVRDLVWSRATAVIWLNFSFGRIFSRALKRTLRRVFQREVLFSGNRETFRGAFLSHDSILRWVITTFRRNRHLYREIISDGTYAPLDVIAFEDTEAASDWLIRLEQEMTDTNPHNLR